MHAVSIVLQDDLVSGHAFSGCVLKSEGTGLAVPLVAGKQCIGRSRETRIKDTRCSKKQGMFFCCIYLVLKISSLFDICSLLVTLDEKKTADSGLGVTKMSLTQNPAESVPACSSFSDLLNMLAIILKNLSLLFIQMTDVGMLVLVTRSRIIPI